MKTPSRRKELNEIRRALNQMGGSLLEVVGQDLVTPITFLVDENIDIPTTDITPAHVSFIRAPRGAPDIDLLSISSDRKAVILTRDARMVLSDGFHAAHGLVLLRGGSPKKETLLVHVKRALSLPPQTFPGHLIVIQGAQGPIHSFSIPNE